MIVEIIAGVVGYFVVGFLVSVGNVWLIKPHPKETLGTDLCLICCWPFFSVFAIFCGLAFGIRYLGERLRGDGS